MRKLVRIPMTWMTKVETKSTKLTINKQFWFILCSSISSFVV